MLAGRAPVPSSRRQGALCRPLLIALRIIWRVLFLFSTHPRVATTFHFMPTDMDKNTEEELVSAIAFALIGASEMKKAKPTWRKADEPRFHLARRIVDHLKLSNWLIRRGKPLDGHSTHPDREK